jgi:hypothetical protein
VNTQHDSSIDLDTQGLSSTPSPLAKSQALETPRTAINDDSQLASSVDQLSTVDILGNFIESKCELGQTFNFKVCFPCALGAELTHVGRLYTSNDGNHRWYR